MLTADMHVQTLLVIRPTMAIQFGLYTNGHYTAVHNFPFMCVSLQGHLPESKPL